MRFTRLTFFCGKGGVGKTVIAAAYARFLARTKKVLLTSMTSRDYMEDLFGVSLTEQRVRAMKNLDLLQLEAKRVMDEFVLRRAPLASLIIKHPVYNTIVNTTPGLQEVLTLTTLDIFYHAKKEGAYEYEALVVDGLSTGHAKSLFRSPEKAMEMIPAGGLHEIAQDVYHIFHDRENTQVVVVTNFEEMPVNETVELVQYCEEKGMACETVIANLVLPPLMRKEAWELFHRIKNLRALWEDAERALQQSGYSFELSHRFFKALSAYDESYKEQQAYRTVLQALLPDREIIEVPYFLKAGKQLLDQVMQVWRSR